VIVRPSIVISAFQEPILGWTETISAMGGLVFAVMLGLINYLNCNDKQILDIVPVDYVSN
jgi:fatty acyl-CoA reductase